MPATTRATQHRSARVLMAWHRGLHSSAMNNTPTAAELRSLAVQPKPRLQRAAAPDCFRLDIVEQQGLYVAPGLDRLRALNSVVLRPRRKAGSAQHPNLQRDEFLMELYRGGAHRVS